MELETIIILFITAFVAAIIHGISGFAFGIVLLMVLPHFFPYAQALALTSFSMLFVVLYNAFFYRKDINWGQLPFVVGIFLIVDLFAVKLLQYVGENQIWYILLGIIFILMAAYMMWGQDKFKIKPTKSNAVIFSVVSGLLNGLFGVGGPVIAVYFLAVSKSKEEYLGTTQMLFVFCLSIDVVLRIVSGMLTPQLMIYSVSSLWCVLLGLLVGQKLFKRMNADTLRKIICVLMVMNAVIMFTK